MNASIGMIIILSMASLSMASEITTITRTQSMETSNDNIVYKTIQGSDTYLYDATVRLWRSNFFVEFPYLFAPSKPDVFLSAEAHVFQPAKDAIIVGAFDNDVLIGYMAGFPFQDANHPDETMEGYIIETSLQTLKEKYKTAFYVNEVLIDPTYRHNTDIIQQLSERMIQEIAKLASPYTTLCMLKAEDDKNHPMRPQNYDELMSTGKIESLFVSMNGFTKTGEFVHALWSTVQPQGEPQMEEHTMYLWTKPL
jgi:hypothetical protein